MRSVRIDAVIERLFAKRGYDRRRRIERVFDVWDEVLGEELAKLARPLSVEDGLLTVTVPDSAAASEVSFSREAILHRINDYLGVPAVDDLRTRVQERSRRPREAPGQVPQSHVVPAEDAFDPERGTLSQQEIAWIEENAARLEGVEARSGLRRVLMIQLKRAKWDEARRRHQQS
ncbi:DUF721 domain-containing protein [Candidatus Poribacteria bacterium]|nr:DUF721 domain-containing protein [Candidatus Poribacteria bacterium]